MPASIKAVITGHSRGLGAAMAEALLDREIPVLACSRQGNDHLAARFPDLLLESRHDLRDIDTLAEWLTGEEIRAFCRDAHTLILINNAGTLGPVGQVETQSPRDIASAVNLNVSAPLMLTSALASLHPGELRVLHISSGAARNPYAGWSVYCATKAALDHHARTLHADGRANLRICSLAPGVVDTDMQQEVRNTPEARFPMQRKFLKLKQDGALSAPSEAADRIIAYLFDPSFGDAAVADIRDLAMPGKT